MLRTCLQALKHRRSACQALLGPQLAATGQPFATPVLAMDAVLARSLQPFGASLRFVKRKTQPKNPASAAEVKVRQLRVNLEIKAEEVRLVDGEKHSLVPRSEAIARARAVNHELVQVGSDRGVPVCKVMKYSAYLADQKSMHEAKAEAQRKGPGAIKLKGIRIGCRPHACADANSSRASGCVQVNERVIANFRNEGTFRVHPMAPTCRRHMQVQHCAARSPNEEEAAARFCREGPPGGGGCYV